MPPPKLPPPPADATRPSSGTAARELTAGESVTRQTPPEAPETDFDLSVVVSTWNRAELLADCLDSLLRQDLPGRRYEILVIDDGSTDETARVVAERSAAVSPRVRYCRQPHRGLNAARNHGVRRARGNVVVFFDDDQLAPAGYLRSIACRFASTTDLDGVGGPVRDTGNSSLRTCRRCSLADADVPGSGPRPTPRLLGGNMALKSELFQRFGPFDEELSGRGDESEWFHRARGARLLQDPELWAWHRRDRHTLRELCRSSLVQGLSLPRFQAKVGGAVRARPGRLVVYLLHAVRYLCSRGLALAFREAGVILGTVQVKLEKS